MAEVNQGTIVAGGIGGLMGKGLKDEVAELRKLQKMNKKLIKVGPKGFKGTTRKGAFRAILNTGVLAGGMGAGLSGGKIDGGQLMTEIGGAAFAEGVEQGLKKGIESAGKKAAAKALKTAGTGIAKKGAAGAAVKISAAAAKASTGVGIALLVFDGLNMALDMIDPCGFSSKELFQKDLNETYAEYLKIYTGIFKDVGIKYIAEIKPDYINSKTAVEQNLLFLEYLDQCNLRLPQDVDKKLKKSRLFQRRMMINTITGSISPSSFFSAMDDAVETEHNPLLFALILRKAKQRKLKQAAIRTAAFVKYMFYIIMWLTFAILFAYVVFK